MKRKWLGLVLATAMACAGAVSAAEYTDSSINYPEGWNDGSNGGTGFMPWQISANNGSGWAGGGIWATADAEVSGDVVDANGKAFGIIGKGDGSSFTATRNFRASLDVGDSFEFDMAVNWDCGSNPDSKKGIALLLDGKDAIVINNDPYPGPMSVNGFTDDPALQNYGTGTMHWTILAKDATTVTVTGTARDGVSDPYSVDIELPSSALTGFRLQSALQQNWEDGDSDEERQAKADKRQSYFNNFKLTIARELPEIVTLGFASGDWEVEAASQTLFYTLTRSSADGALDVTISSSDEAFVAGKTVSFEDGVEAVKFELEATLTGPGNYALISASAPGCDPASYEVKGPGFECSADGSEEPWILAPEEIRTLTITNTQPWGVHGDDALVTVASQDEEVVTVSSLGAWADAGDGKTVASCTVTGVGGGWAPVEVFYDGVKMCDYGFTVVASGATLSGPASLRVGNKGTYKLDVTLAPDFGSDSFQLVADDDTLVSIDPAEEQELTESGTLEFTVTALAPGEVMLSVIDEKGLDADIAPLTVTITEAPDYSKYIAYDDASLYTAGFDFSSTGAGQEGFGAWSVYKDSAEFGGAIITGDAAGFPAILSDGSAFGIYANGSNPDYAIVRPFVNDLQPGQEASIEFVVPTSGGSRYIQFARIWEGTPYNRCEIWANGGAVGINVDGGDSQELGWSVNARRVVASLKRAADGSDYTLNLAGYNEGSEFPDDVFQYVINADVGSWGEGLQGIVIGGYDLGSDFIFNTLSIEQVEEPIVERAIGWAAGVWNPDAAGEYKFAISATTEDIGEVALSVTPAEGALSLSTDSVDLTGVTEASFAVILSEAIEGDSFVITATPADTTVAPIEYNVTVSASYVTLSSDAWEYPVSAGEIWLALSASVSKYGTYAITSSDEAVLAVPEASEAITVGSPDKSWFNVAIVGPGKATIYATAEGEETPAAEYTFTVIADAPVIDGTTIEVSFADGDGLSGKVDDALRDQFTNVKAQVLQWNGVDAFDEVEVLENEAEWPDMQFTPSIDNPVIRLIFVK